MKKILLVSIMLLLMIGCSNTSTDYGLGEYKDRQYINKDFKMDFEIPEGFAFLNEEELEKVNAAAVENAENPEAQKHYNKILDITNVDGVSLYAIVDSTPNAEMHAEREANAYLDFLSGQNINYKVNRSEKSFNDLEYFHINLELDFDKIQDTYIAISEGKLITIQITYDKNTIEQADQLVEMLGSNA